MKRICKQCGKEFVLTQDEIAFYQSKNLHIPKRCEACRRENRVSGKTGEQIQPRQVVRAYHGKENDRKKSWTAVAAVLILLAVVILGFRMGFLPGLDGGAAQEQTVQTFTGEVADISGPEDSEGTLDVSGLENPKSTPDISEVENPKGTSEILGPENPKSTPDISETENLKNPTKIADDGKPLDDVLLDDAVEEIEAASVSAVTYTYNFRRAEYLQEHFEKHGAEFGYATAEEYLAGANRVIASADVLHKLEAEDGDDVYYLEATNEFVIVSTDGFLRTYFKPEDGKAYYDRQ